MDSGFVHIDPAIPHADLLQSENQFIQLTITELGFPVPVFDPAHGMRDVEQTGICHLMS
jgi:hypothetical protein